MFYFRHSVPSSVLRLLENGSRNVQAQRLETAGFQTIVIRGIMRPNTIITNHTYYYTRALPPKFHAKFAFDGQTLHSLHVDDLVHFWYKNIYGVHGNWFVLPHDVRPKSVMVL